MSVTLPDPAVLLLRPTLLQVWSTISARSGESTGALTRLHSSLISTVTHLISRLGVAAMGDPHVAAVLLPLLHHATNIGMTGQAAARRQC